VLTTTGSAKGWAVLDLAGQKDGNEKESKLWTHSSSRSESLGFAKYLPAERRLLASAIKLVTPTFGRNSESDGTENCGAHQIRLYDVCKAPVPSAGSRQYIHL
jgi:hypothetical protein